MSAEEPVAAHDRFTLAVWLCLLHRIDSAVAAMVMR